ncbi:MAG: hypothetical protein IJC56_00140 [Clostridia bacterium]|nr:hypothetical protein [Clostridia bacterium]
MIRIWTAEECNAESWLNACAGILEESYDGVYINVQVVTDEALATYARSGVNPPDILIYNAGTVSDTSLLSPITAAYPLRDGIRQDIYAVPVLLRPRFWIYDPGAYDSLPGDMHDVRAACADRDVIALTALCTGLRPAEGEAIALPGIDLGLNMETHATRAPAGEVACRVSPDIVTDEDPRKLYTDNKIDAFVGGVGDVLRLDECAAAATGEYAYADDVIVCSIVDKADGRDEVCRAFMDVLIGEGQALAARAQAFPAIVGASGWEGNRVLGSVEEALRDKIWLSGAHDAEAAYLYIEGKISADEAIERIVGSNK